MSSAGHILDSIKRMQANRRLQKQNRNAYRQKLSELNQSSKSGKTFFTPEELEKERTILRNQIKKQGTYKIISFVILSLIFCLFVLIYFLF